jgi:protein N-terminal amidase
MKIATLQFSPRVGDIARNFSMAESLLMREEREGLLQDLDLLVLPELAFSGYNHPSLSAIAPHLEPTAAGPSTRWAARTAKRLKCTVAVGYPEAADGEGNYNTNFDATITTSTKAYNALVFVNCVGDVVAHYRKSFLYYTDETWALEGPGFHAGVLPLGQNGSRVKCVAGICMDINPYRFEAPWTAYEFANHARESRAKLLVLSMAWLTRLTQEAVQEEAMMPDFDTVGYWIERFKPLVGVDGLEEEVVVVCANRTGEEGIAERIGEVRYAGSSCVMGLTKGDGEMDGEVRIWDILGRAQEGIMVIDTGKEPKYRVAKKMTGLDASGEVPGETDPTDPLEPVLGESVEKTLDTGGSTEQPTLA